MTAPEILHYIFVICEAATVYIWDNIYQYDIAFRQSIAKNHDRKWNVILQHAWSLFLKEKIDRNSVQTFSNGT